MLNARKMFITKKLFRPVCLFGATFSSVSLLLSAAAPTLPILYLTFGLLLGASLRSEPTFISERKIKLE